MESRDMTESGLGAVPTGTLLDNRSPRTLDRMWAQDLLCSCSMHAVQIDKRERSAPVLAQDFSMADCMKPLGSLRELVGPRVPN